ncbi:MAG TPA: TonB-dependent receptor [Steroidobacteraceae bacterium]|jgi:outer membrane receptor protein involved in Fe transport|nr:TonB-dependent receptor [Steroidobacteraceae bacterium]
MNHGALIHSARLVGIAVTFAPCLLYAQDQQQPQEPTTGPSLQEVVVTATATSVRKLDASYTIVTADQEQIRRANPKSTADLLKISPGIWPESTGGQTGANIEVAGFPTGGDAPYFTVQLMGSPLYGMPTLSFFEQSTIMRLDDTIERVEIVQGGPSVVFADAQPGATANFILRRGSRDPTGNLGFTYGSENLARVDGFYGFPVGGEWVGSVGGFYRVSDGVRDPQYKADKGGQFTATLSRDFDNARLMFYGRYLNDKNQFITPIPLIQTGTDHFHAYPGFDPLKGTYNSEALRHVFLPSYPGGGTNADLADGRGADFGFLGGNLDWEFGEGWSLTDRLLVNGGTADTNALFSSSNPATLVEELFTLPTDLGGFALPAGAVAVSEFVGGGPVDPDQSVIKQGWWHIHKRLRNVNNDLRVSKKIFTDNTLTLGAYLAYYEMDDKWSLGNTMLMTNEPNARPITVNYTSGGQTFSLTDPQGFSDFSGFHIIERGHASNKAIYLSDSWRLDKWLLDASYRYEWLDATNRVCNLVKRNIDGNPLTLYDNAVDTCDGTFAVTDYSPSHGSWTAGVNYTLLENMSVYARYNEGVHFSDFDNGIRGSTSDAPPPLATVSNREIGWKWQTSWIYADISAYRKVFNGIPYTPSNGLGVPLTGQRFFYGADSKGVNVNLAVTPIKNLTVQFVGNYLDGRYTHYDACVPYVNFVVGNGCARIEGQMLQRQPKIRFAVQPSYTQPMPWGDMNVFVTYSHVGKHTQDQSGLQQLGTYDTLDFGISANVGDNWQFRIQGTNVTNELGLTESNSRIFGPAAGAGGVILARPLEGREVNGQVVYKF